jgi:DNA repair exonuclease SbcCD ATPase subunit
MVNFAGEPFAAIQQAYKALYEERQIVNRQVREFSIPSPLPMPAGVDSHSLEDRLTGLRIKRREKQLERDQEVSKATENEVNRVRVKTRLEAIEESIRKESDRAQSIAAFVLPDDKIASLRKVAGGKAELDRLSKEKVDAGKVIDDYMRQLGRLEEIADAGKTCPTCDQPIDQAKLAKLSGTLAVGLKEVKDQNNRLHQKIMALGEVEEAMREIALNEDRGRELAAIDERIEEKSRQLADEPQPEPVLFDFAPYDQSLAELDAEVEKLSEQLRPVIAAEERRKEIAIRQEQHDRLREKAAALDQLVKYFGPDGIKAKLIGEYIGGFEGRINEVMSAWGYKAALSIEPYSFDVTNARGDTSPVRELSGAERVMFSLAFQCAVAMTASIGLVVIDEVAMFLPELRPVLNKRLWEMVQQGYLEQVILLVADASEQVPKLPGAAFFMVDEGSVHALDNGVKAEHGEAVLRG